MKGKDQGKVVPPPADMAICFPTRAHLRLMPKPICSPARLSEIGRHRRCNSHHVRSSSIRAVAAAGGGYGGIPNLWAKEKNLDISEPSSPKVTCAGQIKVRPRRNSCQNWRSVMEEFERIQSNRKQRRSAWREALKFVTCLGGARETETSDDEEEEDDDVGTSDQIAAQSSKAYSSNWFMIINEEKDEDQSDDYNFHKSDETPEIGDKPVAVAPPPNALLLMRCRSAPAKSWQEEEEKAQNETREWL